MLLIDYDALVRRCLDKASVANSVLSLFAEAAAAALARTERALADSDTDEVARQAQTLAELSAHVYAEPLREVAAHVEHLAQAGSEAAARTYLPQLRLVLQRSLEYVAELRESSHAQGPAQ